MLRIPYGIERIPKGTSLEEVFSKISCRLCWRRCRSGLPNSREVCWVVWARNVHGHWTKAGKQGNACRAKKKTPVGMQVNQAWCQNWQAEGVHKLRGHGVVQEPTRKQHTESRRPFFCSVSPVPSTGKEKIFTHSSPVSTVAMKEGNKGWISRWIGNNLTQGNTIYVRLFYIKQME